MGGFSADLKRKILGNNAHIVVDTTSQSSWSDAEATLARVRAIKGVEAATPVVQGEVMAQSASNLAGVIVHGVDPATIGNVIDLRKNIEAPVKVADKLAYLANPELLRHIPADEVIGIGPGGEEYTKGPDLPLLGDDLDPRRGSRGRSAAAAPRARHRARARQGAPRHRGRRHHAGLPAGRSGAHGRLAEDAEVSHRRDLLQRDVRIRRNARVLDDRRERRATSTALGQISAIDIRVDDAENADRLTDAVVAAVARPELRVRDWRGHEQETSSSALKAREDRDVSHPVDPEIIRGDFCIVCTLLLLMTEKAKGDRHPEGARRDGRDDHADLL